MQIHKSVVAVAVAAALVGFSVSEASAAQVKFTPKYEGTDLGLAPSTEVKSVTLGLKIVNRSALEAYVKSTTDRTSPNFRKFLTPAQFKASYGQPDATVARIRAYLEARGVKVTKVFANNLLISAQASNAQLTSIFGAPIHSFSLNGVKFQRPVATAAVPPELSDVVGTVSGLSTRTVFKPNHAVVPNVGRAAVEASVTKNVVPTPRQPATGVPGQYTVVDLAAQYNVNPLYARGLSGAGVTLGILTFAGFDPTDAYTYWASLGLKVSADRITRIPVDGGSGNDDGGDETTLDVEQSGGLAPGAKIVVYEAPNTDAGAIDLYAQAIEENLADTFSVSWGLAEIAQDPNEFDAYDAIFLQAAAQGIPLTASAGDSGAFDINRDYAYPGCSPLLSVDFPASNALVFAAGGTTLPGVIPRRYGTVAVPVERPWAWDYLRDYYVKYYGQGFYYSNVFPVGGGGGISIYFDLPTYQQSLPGTKTTASAQSLICFGSNGASDLIDMPVGFAGRNVPDVSLNADPFTGYSLYYGGQWITNFGGTSFVAPQLNGIFALITEAIKTRVGQPHPQFYSAFKAKGYSAGSPFRAIVSGDDLFYAAGTHFNPATGLGALDVDNLLTTLSAK